MRFYANFEYFKMEYSLTSKQWLQFRRIFSRNLVRNHYQASRWLMANRFDYDGCKFHIISYEELEKIDHRGISRSLSIMYNKFFLSSNCISTPPDSIGFILFYNGSMPLGRKIVKYKKGREKICFYLILLSDIRITFLKTTFFFLKITK